MTASVNSDILKNTFIHVLLQAVRRFLVSNPRWKISCQLLWVLALIFAGKPLFAATTPATDRSVRAIVSGIVSYTRWPDLTGAPRLCIFSSSRFMQALSNGASAPLPYQPVVVKNDHEALAAGCNALYFGNESPSQQIALTGKLQPRPVLSIAEQNPECAAGSAFCLIFHSATVKFSVNLDVLTRSGVRVNPEVLMLARTKEHE
ncbi:YfiR family protein [Trabulsiella guamensis ATCC 49490]|uniref:YfiR family protein n=1 Tax=Trabulsiella guamensis ATCC 49490 TaxID=1005994 RepID=A0A085A8I2_9ENTR|nr:YfiR family protein [Trabulsiella guamensis]KFC06527.1 YfiR family protein [Trabulsiella guamensis ATCC 49490]